MRRVIFGLVLSAIFAPGNGNAQNLELYDLKTEDDAIFDLNSDRRQERGTSFTLRIPNTPEHIRNAHILDVQGREIRFRLLLDDTRQWILGTHRDDVQIELLHRLDDGTFLISGRDGERVLDLEREDLFVTDLNFGEHCFDLKGIDETDIPFRISVALDVSGSMEDVLSEVAGSFRDFVRETPERAQCMVIAFDHGHGDVDPSRGPTWGDPSFRSCQDYRGFPGGALTTRGGGTRVADALIPLYKGFLEQTNEINLLLVLSDGVGKHDTKSQISRLEQLRSDAVERSGVYTIVNWLGGYNTGYPLARLADQSVFGASAGLAGRSFFQQGLQTVRAQSVLRVEDCPKGG